MSDALHKIYGPDGHIPEEVLLRYVSGTLSPGDQHKVERHALGCEICSDVMEGLLAVRNREKIPVIIDSIKKEVRLKTTPQTKVVRMTTRTWISMAAGITLVMGLGYFFLQQGSDLKSPVTSEEIKPGGLSDTVSGSTVDETGKGETKPDIFTVQPKESKEKVADATLEESPSESEDIVVENVKSADDAPAPKVTNPSGPENKKAELDDVEKNVPTKETTSQEGDMDLSNVPVTSTKDEKQKLEELKKQENSGKGKKKVNKDSKKKTRSNAYGEYKNNEPKQDKAPEKTVTTDPTPSPNQVIVPMDNNSYNTVPNTSTTTTTTGNSNSQGYVTHSDTVVPPPNTFAAGKWYYQTKEYQKSIDNLKSVIEQEPANNEARFYFGMSYYYTGNNDLAILHLEKVTNNTINFQYDEARYTLALAYLKKGDKVTAKKILEEISKGTGPNKNKAVQKLDEIK